MIYSAFKCLLHSGTVSTKKGTLLKRKALTYKDRLNNLPTANEMKRAKMIGKNRLTFSVVSSIMTASEKLNREYPASTLAAPIMA